MTDIYKSVLFELPHGTELTEHNVKNIHRLFPVPTDFTVLWASVETFLGHPSGIIVTDQALIIKGTSKGVKATNDERGKQSENLTALYQIILWEHFDFDDLSIEAEKEGKYSIIYASTKFSNFSNECLANVFVDKIAEHSRAIKVNFKAAIDSSALNIIGLDNVIFAAAYGADTSDTGHGIYAEEASAILDKVNLEKVEVVGRDNAKNGPDKIVNGNPVQCKYCNTSSSSVGNCFKINAAGVKEFRYYDISGNPMMVEVPKDQYDKAIELMKSRILDGQVPGVTDINAAYSIIRKGKLTYVQARNLAKAGTIESLVYDTVTGAINCSFAFGLSAMVSFAFTFHKTKNPKEAARDAALTGLQTFGLSLATQVLSTQIARTGLQKSLISISELIVQNMGSKTTQTLINAIRRLAGKKPIYGGAAQKSLAKALRSNAITQGIAFVVFIVPDTVRITRRKMSGYQYAKNVSSLFMSFAGAGAVGLGGTVLLGMKATEKIPHPAAKVVVFVVSAVGGIVVGEGVRKTFETFREDDAVVAQRMFNAVIMNICVDYMFGENEIEQFLSQLFSDIEIKKALKLTMKNLYSSKKQYVMLRAVMDGAAMKVAKMRPLLTKIQEPDDDILSDALAEIIEESELEVES